MKTWRGSENPDDVSVPERKVATRGPATRVRPGPWPNPTRGSDMADISCSMQGCERKYESRGYCKMHAQRVRLHGTPGPVDPIRPGGHGSSACAPETRRKIAATQAGKRSVQWSGDDVGYMGMHKRARAVLPRRCASADGSCAGQLDAALRSDAPAEFLRHTPYGTHSTRLEDYIRLCRSHHVRYDRGNYALAPPRT
jgi:hypothetical protein